MELLVVALYRSVAVLTQHEHHMTRCPLQALSTTLTSTTRLSFLCVWFVAFPGAGSGPIQREGAVPACSGACGAHELLEAELDVKAGLLNEPSNADLLALQRKLK
jgi:hypothetical protein